MFVLILLKSIHLVYNVSFSISLSKQMQCIEDVYIIIPRFQAVVNNAILHPEIMEW